MAHELAIAHENIAYDRIVRADVVDTYAYVVLSERLSFTIKGQHAVGSESFGEAGRRVEDRFAWPGAARVKSSQGFCVATKLVGKNSRG